MPSAIRASGACCRASARSSNPAAYSFRRPHAAAPPASARRFRQSLKVVVAAAVNGMPAAAAAKKAPAAVRPFTNTLKFYVPNEKVSEFEATWRAREAVMSQHPGFQGLKIVAVEDTFTVSSSWASIPQWETFSLSECSRRTHLPWGVLQYVPARGEGFPEDFVPFVNYNTPVDAKY